MLLSGCREELVRKEETKKHPPEAGGGRNIKAARQKNEVRHEKIRQSRKSGLVKGQLGDKNPQLRKKKAETVRLKNTGYERREKADENWRVKRHVYAKNRDDREGSKVDERTRQSDEIPRRRPPKEP